MFVCLQHDSMNACFGFVFFQPCCSKILIFKSFVYRVKQLFFLENKTTFFSFLASQLLSVEADFKRWKAFIFLYEGNNHMLYLNVGYFSMNFPKTSQTKKKALPFPNNSKPQTHENKKGPQVSTRVDSLYDFSCS